MLFSRKYRISILGGVLLGVGLFVGACFIRHAESYRVLAETDGIIIQWSPDASSILCLDTSTESKTRNTISSLFILDVRTGEKKMVIDGVKYSRNSIQAECVYSNRQIMSDHSLIYCFEDESGKGLMEYDWAQEKRQVIARLPKDAIPGSISLGPQGLVAFKCHGKAGAGQVDLWVMDIRNKSSKQIISIEFQPGVLGKFYGVDYDWSVDGSKIILPRYQVYDDAEDLLEGFRDPLEFQVVDVGTGQVTAHPYKTEKHEEWVGWGGKEFEVLVYYESCGAGHVDIRARNFKADRDVLLGNIFLLGAELSADGSRVSYTNAKSMSLPLVDEITSYETSVLALEWE